MQELTEDDFDRRVEFCEQMNAAINDNTIHVKNICSSDECTFYLNGFVKKHICRYWSNENPHAFVEGHTQYLQKINLRTGNKVIGPFFTNGNLNGDIYLDMLENQSAYHYILPVRQWLDDELPDKWIEQEGHIKWPVVLLI